MGENDRLVGLAGSDLLKGAAGRDVVDAVDGPGFVDVLTCGAGAGDRALADMADRVGAGCEDVMQNDAPTEVMLSDDTVAENLPVSTVVGTLSAADADLGDRHTFTFVAGSGSRDNGSFRIIGTELRTGEVFDFETRDTYSIRVRATDPEGTFVDEPLTIAIVDVDDAPTAVDDTATGAEDAAAAAVDVLANDTDVDGGPRTIRSVTQPGNGSVVITAGGTGLTYEPDADYCSDPPGTPDTFTYSLNGGSVGIVSVTVSCVDDFPVAVDDTAAVMEDAAATAVDVLVNDTDIDGGPMAVGSVTQPANGTVVITGGGTGLTYEPAPNYCNHPPGTTPDTFIYTLNGGDSASVSVTVTCLASISTSLSAAPAAPAINQIFSYDADLVNTGVVPLDEVTMTVVVPVEMNVTSVTTGAYSGFPLTNQGSVRLSNMRRTRPWASSRCGVHRRTPRPTRR